MRIDKARKIIEGMKKPPVKPCPFCGSEDIVIAPGQNSRAEEGFAYSCVTCQECGAEVYGEAVNYYNNPENKDADLLALEVWNRRATDEDDI